MRYYSGMSKARAQAVVESDDIQVGFHMTPDVEIARKYAGPAGVVVAIDFIDHFDAHVGTINKEGNYNKDTGNGIEVVLQNSQHLNSFWKVYDGASLVV